MVFNALYCKANLTTSTGSWRYLPRLLLENIENMLRAFGGRCPRLRCIFLSRKDIYSHRAPRGWAASGTTNQRTTSLRFECIGTEFGFRIAVTIIMARFSEKTSYAAIAWQLHRKKSLSRLRVPRMDGEWHHEPGNNFASI